MEETQCPMGTLKGCHTGGHLAVETPEVLGARGPLCSVPLPAAEVRVGEAGTGPEEAAWETA